MATADRIRAAAELVIKESGEGKVVVVSAMGSHPSSPVKVTDLLLSMIKRAANSDAAFLLDLAALQDKHVETAKALLGQSGELTAFVSRLLDDISNLKAMLQAMSIGGLDWARGILRWQDLMLAFAQASKPCTPDVCAHSWHVN
jgi:aspartokinase/homoserine dehydrogenase 1